MNKVNSPAPAKSKTMMYLGIAIVVIVVLGLIGYGIYRLVSKSKVKSGGDTVATGNSNSIDQKEIEVDNFYFAPNSDTGDVEILNNDDDPVWSSQTPGGEDVTWMIDKDGIFRVYHYDTNRVWRSVKAAEVTDKTLIGEANGPYTYKFTNDGVFSVLNKSSKVVWNTKSGKLVIDITKTIEPTFKTSKSVSVNNQNSVNISLSN